MSAAFHRGLTQDLRRRLQTAGIRIEENQAQQLLLGRPVLGPSSPAQDAARTLVTAAWDDRFTIMPRWENDHPGQPPFPPIFAEVVLGTLQKIAAEQGPDVEDFVLEIIKLAEAELEL